MGKGIYRQSGENEYQRALKKYQARKAQEARQAAKKQVIHFAVVKPQKPTN